MKCNRGPRPDSRALCLHGVYIYRVHSPPTSTTPPTLTPTHPEKNCLIKLPQHIAQQNYSINTTAGISYKYKRTRRHRCVAAQLFVCFTKRRTLAGLLIALFSSRALPILLILTSPGQPNEAFQSRDVVVKVSCAPC